MHPHRHNVQAPLFQQSLMNPLSVSSGPVKPPITARTHHHGNKTEVCLKAVGEQRGVEEIYAVCLVSD